MAAELTSAALKAPEIPVVQDVGCLSLVQTVNIVGKAAEDASRLDSDGIADRLIDSSLRGVVKKPKIGTIAAHYLMERGSIVGRIAAKEKVLKTVCEFMVEDQGVSVCPEPDKLEAEIEDLKQQLHLFDANYQAEQKAAEISTSALDSPKDTLVESSLAELNPDEFSISELANPEPYEGIIAAHTDTYKLYIKEIRKIPLLNAEQEVELARSIEAGLFAKERLSDPDWINKTAKQHFIDGKSESDDPKVLRRELENLVAQGKKAAKHLVEANMRLVVSIAKRYVGRGLDILDLLQEGSTGLIKAMEKFDYTLGYKFSTYATWWIRQAITRAIADQGYAIRLPSNLREEVNRMDRYRTRLQVELGREPTHEEIAEESVIPLSKVEEYKIYGEAVVSLHSPVRNYKDSSGANESLLGDFIEDCDLPAVPELVESNLLREQVEKVLSRTLTQREARVIALYYGLIDGQKHTLQSIGKEYGVTGEAIRLIRNGALDQLKRSPYTQYLRFYLD